MSVRLFLIRHGQTDWNLEKRYCSLTDIDLNNKGILQARKLCHRLGNEKINKIYSSDSMRALNFARIVFKETSIESTPELREMNFGIFEGLTHEEIMERYPKIYTRWLNNPFRLIVPESDSLSNFKKRVEKILARIISLNKNKILAIITHAGPIKIIIGNILNSKDIWAINPDLASLSIIDFRNNNGKVRLFNDTDYLNG